MPIVQNSTNEPVAVIETRLAHDTHRAASALLADAAKRPSVPSAALTELRDFLVANLHHHHESEDRELWPLVVAASSERAEGLAALSTEHEELDAALDALGSMPVEDGAGRDALAKAAIAVRDIVARHLAHEEPLLFPALRELSPETWDAFSEQVIATTPPVGAHLMVGFLDQVGTAEEVEILLSRLPEPLQQFVPQMRLQAKETFAALAPAN